MKKLIAIICAVFLLCSLYVSASAAGAFSHAKIEGNSYSSEEFGVACELDEGWYVANDDELAELLGVTKDMLSDDKLNELIENSGYFYDFYASKQTSNSAEGVNIVVEKFDSVLQAVYVKSQSEEDFIAAVIGELKSEGYFEALLASLGLENGEITQSTVPFCGKDTPCICVQGTYSGVPLYETIVYVTADDFMGAVTASALFENTTPDILGTFTELTEVNEAAAA